MSEIHNGDVLPLEFMARREDWSNGISLYARQVTVGYGDAVAEPLTLQRAEPNMCVQPFSQIGMQSAQKLMDELWQCGLRPSEGTGSAGSLAATQRHLEDMRKIAFGKLGIDG